MKWEKIVIPTLLFSSSFYIWLGIAFLFLILEMTSPGLFFFISFFFGGITAAITGCFTENVITQIIFFLLGTVFSLYIMRYWVAGLISSGNHQRTNMYALRGKHAIVTQVITLTTPGLVKINGQVWAARVLRDETIMIGERVEVVDVRGAHVVVKKID